MIVEVNVRDLRGGIAEVLHMIIACILLLINFVEGEETKRESNWKWWLLCLLEWLPSQMKKMNTISIQR